jgi:hypothetical protein
MNDSAVEYYARKMREVHQDYERCLSGPRSCIMQMMRYHIPTYILHHDGTLEARNNYTPEMEVVLKQARRITEEIHEMFREPMQKAVADYQRAIRAEEGWL